MPVSSRASVARAGPEAGPGAPEYSSFIVWDAEPAAWNGYQCIESRLHGVLVRARNLCAVAVCRWFMTLDTSWRG